MKRLINKGLTIFVSILFLILLVDCSTQQPNTNKTEENAEGIKMKSILKAIFDITSMRGMTRKFNDDNFIENLGVIMDDRENRGNPTLRHDKRLSKETQPSGLGEHKE